MSDSMIYSFLFFFKLKYFAVNRKLIMLFKQKEKSTCFILNCAKLWQTHNKHEKSHLLRFNNKMAHIKY